MRRRDELFRYQGTLDVLNAPATSQKFPQRRLPFHIRVSAQVFAAEYQKVEGLCCGSIVIELAMKRIEVRYAIIRAYRCRTKRPPMHILSDITVVAILVVTAWAIVSTATRHYGDVSIWPME